MRFVLAALVLVFFSFMLVVPGLGSIISISNVTIDPVGIEDQTTHAWKGSFWVITAVVDTTESYLLLNASGAYSETTSHMFDSQASGDKEINVSSTVKITITPRQPYWEIPLKPNSYMVYPKTYGTCLNTIDRNHPSKISDHFVPELDVAVLEPILPYQCNLYTPFDITVEKIGNNSFTQTVHLDTLGGADTVVVSNPTDNSEKVMIQDLGKLESGLSTPSLEDMLIIHNSIAFKKTEVIKAIEYGRDATGTRKTDECYAFYWFGGGNYTVDDGGPCYVGRWDDDVSPNHIYWKQDIGVLGHNCLVSDGAFPGSYRGPDEGPLWWPPNSYNQYVYPIKASEWEDNTNSNPPGRSLISYLRWKFNSSFLDLNYLQQGWAITSENKLRIYAPTASASSLITMKISSELVDSVVYQPMVGFGKCEQAYWDSSKTTSCSIKDKDTVVLKVKQFSSQSSKITVTTSVPANLPISVTPQTDSAIIDPETTHNFQFEMRNLGTQTKQNGTITFTMKNDLGTVTDTQTLEFALLPSENPSGAQENIGSLPLWIWLAIVGAIAGGSIIVYSIYRFRFSPRKKLPEVGPEVRPEVQTPPPPPPPSEPSQGPVSRKQRRHRKILIASFILLGILVSLGVYYYDAYHKLSVGLVGAGLGDVGYTSAEVRLTLEVRNPNMLPVYIPSGDFDITINDQSVGSGHFGPVTVVGNGRGSIVVPVTFYITDLPLVVFGLLTGGGNVTIKVEGSANMFLFGVPFSSTLYNVKLT